MTCSATDGGAGHDWITVVAVETAAGVRGVARDRAIRDRRAWAALATDATATGSGVVRDDAVCNRCGGTAGSGCRRPVLLLSNLR